MKHVWDWTEMIFKKTWQSEVCKEALFGAERGGNEGPRLRKDWQREAVEGEGVREKWSARSRWWQQASHDQNLLKTSKGITEAQ